MLALSQEHELDELGLPIERIIETFPEDVQPFAVQIATQLVRACPR